MDEFVPFVRGSTTSLKAADSMREKAPSDQQRVYDYIVGTGERGATDDEIEVALELIHQNASARRRALELKGDIRKTIRSRRTRHNRWAAVYVWADLPSESDEQ